MSTRPSCAARAKTAISSSPARFATVAFESQCLARAAAEPARLFDSSQRRLETALSWAARLKLTAGGGEFLIEHRVGVAGGLPLRFVVGLGLCEVRVNRLAVGKVERDYPGHFVQL